MAGEDRPQNLWLRPITRYLKRERSIRIWTAYSKSGRHRAPILSEEKITFHILVF